MCVLASVLSVPLISLVNLVCQVGPPSVSVSDCEIVEPRTFNFSRKRGASVALEYQQRKETKSNMEAGSF